MVVDVSAGSVLFEHQLIPYDKVLTVVGKSSSISPKLSPLGKRSLSSSSTQLSSLC